MNRIANILARFAFPCLTDCLHSPHIYSMTPRSRRIRLISLRLRLAWSRRKMAARDGLVLWRGFGGSLAT